jgi:flavin reductase (DIM6/NTAB) family NADH-FMN oxidoreductase RutF
MRNDNLQSHRYLWPPDSLADSAPWTLRTDKQAYVRDGTESAEQLASDSRWPAFFPSPLCCVATGTGDKSALEKVVGASIVNRFPYVMAISVCRQELSDRHYARREFANVLEKSGKAVVQFLRPGGDLDATMRAIQTIPDADAHLRIARTGLSTQSAATSDVPVFDAAYLAYEAKLVEPTVDFDGQRIFETPWLDVGSHRVYFLEITAIQLCEDIARGRTQIRWRSLPDWSAPSTPTASPSLLSAAGKYQKGYNPDYAFPSAGTIAFEFDEVKHGRAIKYLPPLPADQVEVDNDRARWPCFFPCSLGMITTWAAPGVPNLMPCGSTTVISRHPLTIAVCVSYAAINARYAPRATLAILRDVKRFGCGVPFLNEAVLNAIRYAGNTSFADDPQKVARTSLTMDMSEWAPVLTDLPVHFDCEVTGEVRLGTHIMFLGEVRRIRVRADVGPANPLDWCPWADVTPVEQPAFSS